MNQLIKFHFKGTRTYVQGGDFYDKVSELLGDDEFINDISFRKITDKNCYIKDVPEEDDDVIGIVKTNIRNYALAQSTESVSDSCAFDEDKLIENAILNGDSIMMYFDQQFTLIENIIVLTKKLNYSINPKVNGKWLFGQLKLEQPFPVQVKNICINSTRRIPNRFSENRITLDNITFGTIIFIVGKP